MNSAKIKQLFQVSLHPTFASVTILILRLVVGWAFIQHGWGKIQTPFNWMPAEAPVPGFLQFLAAFSEFGGGIALILGLLTPLACLGIAITMAVATSMHAFTLGDPFVNLTGGRSFEPALIYLTIALVMMSVGPGQFSMDRKIFGLKK